LLDAIREGAETGAIRSDLEPEALLVRVLGTIHVLAGLSASQRDRNAALVDPDRGLKALAVLLVPINAAPLPPQTRKGKS